MIARFSLIAVLCTFLSIAGILSAADPFDVSKPETWEASIDAHERRGSELAHALMARAKAAKESGERMEAITLLARTGNRQSLKCMVDNISLPSLKLASTEFILDDDLSCPPLLHRCEEWILARLIFESLDVPKTDRECQVLSRTFNRTLAAAIELEFGKSDLSEDRKQNLQRFWNVWATKEGGHGASTDCWHGRARRELVPFRSDPGGGFGPGQASHLGEDV